MRRFGRVGFSGSGFGGGSRGLGPVWLWKNFATTGFRGDEHEVYAPMERRNGCIRYGVYSFGRYGAPVMHLGRIKIGMPVMNTWHGDLSKVGTWTTVSEARIPGGSTTRSNNPGDVISGNVSGRALWIRYYTNVNGGFGIVGIDGDESAAVRLPEVASSDFGSVEGVADDGGECRIASVGHGLANGARVLVEDVLGVPGANGKFSIRRIDNDAFALEGSTFSGSYAGGGTFGYFSQSDLGKRYLECYANLGGLFDEQAPLVDGLADASHSISVRATGTARAGGSSGGRAYVTGFAAATAGLRLGSSNVSMGYLHELGNLRSSSFSALGSAIEFRPSEGSELHFVGESHGNENEIDLTWEIDGGTVGLSSDEYLSGGVVSLRRTTELTHPEAIGAIAEREALYTTSVRQLTPVRLRQRIAWLQAGTAERAYHGMFHAGVRAYAASSLLRSEFDRARIGGRLVADFGFDDDASLGKAIADEAAFWASGHRDFEAGVASYDVSHTVNDWQYSDPLYVFATDRSDGTDKLYFTRSTQSTPEPIGIGDVHESDVGWFVRPRRRPWATASDAFLRADASKAGSTDGRVDGGAGVAWSELAGTWGIAGERLAPTGSDPGDGWRTGVEIGSTDALCCAEVDETVGGGVGLVLRYASEAEHWRIVVAGSAFTAWKVQGGSAIAAASGTAPSGNLQRLWATCDGDSLRCGAESNEETVRLSADATGGPDGTRWGVHSSESGGVWRQFSVYAME
ncbi:MAG: hypothetical protein KDA61_07475 [Planctomycetales bacterium]|nr:hypothetical protein [Planctomycetales bacterium]